MIEVLTILREVLIILVVVISLSKGVINRRGNKKPKRKKRTKK